MTNQNTIPLNEADTMMVALKEDTTFPPVHSKEKGVIAYFDPLTLPYAIDLGGVPVSPHVLFRFTHKDKGVFFFTSVGEMTVPIEHLHLEESGTSEPLDVMVEHPELMEGGGLVSGKINLEVPMFLCMKLFESIHLTKQNK